LRVVAAAALCVAAGCAGPGVIKAYPGPDRGSSEVGVIATTLTEQEFQLTDNVIASVDGARIERTAYNVQVLAGAHRIGVQGTLRAGRMKPRIQYCSFDLNVEGGCTYRPAIPAYPRSAYDQPPDAEWRSTRPMTVVAECSDTSYAIQLPLDCSSNP
jgi:hypothetical protein